MKLKRLVSVVLLHAFALGASAQTVAPQQAAADAAAARHHLMPVPASVKFVAGRLPITKSFTVGAQGFVDERLRAGVERMLRRLEGRTVMELARGLAADPKSATLTIECKGPGRAVPSVDEDESYTLEINLPQSTIHAPTVVGALRGLETFLQLLEGDREGFYIPAVIINDRPRFRWRGLLIDIGRHYEPPEVLKRNIDAMAAVKMNVLHWHLTEDQGFRIESKKFPRLTAMGSDGNYYTQEQARDIIALRRRARHTRRARVRHARPQRRAGSSATPSSAARPALTRSSAARGSSTPRSTRRARRLTSSSTHSSARWPRSSPTRTCTSAATRTTASSGTRTRRFKPS